MRKTLVPENLFLMGWGHPQTVAGGPKMANSIIRKLSFSIRAECPQDEAAPTPYKIGVRPISTINRVNRSVVPPGGSGEVLSAGEDSTLVESQ